jgi:hypothetical protein
MSPRQRRDVREVEPLGDHLRAEEHVHLAARHAVEDVGVRPLRAGGVHVHARDARRRPAIGEQPLHLLRSHAPLLERAPRAPCAPLARRLVVLAVVADEPLGRAVIGERDAAVRARGHVAAVAALHEAE